MSDEQELWDRRYSGGEFLFGTAPSDFLQAQVFRLTRRARILCVADGQGRNSVWLASFGFQVLATDISPVGLEQAEQLARQRGVNIATERCDMNIWTPSGEFDAIVEVSAHFPSESRRAIHRKLSNVLRPGGFYLIESFHERQIERGSGGPRDPDMLATADKLRGDFAELDILLLMEGVVRLDEGPKHQGDASVVHFVARKTIPTSLSI